MMPSWHHTEYSTPICPVTKSTIKKTIYSNAGLCQNIQFMDRISMVYDLGYMIYKVFQCGNYQIWRTLLNFKPHFFTKFFFVKK